jgi:penicillin amidase
MFPGRDTLTLVWRIARDLLRPVKQLSITQRLAMIPAASAPISRPVSIWFDEHQIPFIEADTDEDLAIGLGIVHAHLRLAQMELMRRATQGRVAELVGHRGLFLDRLVRTFDIARAVPEILAHMPEPTRAWLDGFVRGINHVIERGVAPREFRLLGIKKESWTAADVVALGRLISADVSWLLWLRVFRLRGRPDWPRLWREFCSADTLSIVPGQSEPAFAALRSGSNSFAVAGSRTESGGALIGSDPHLSITLPNNWLLAGMKSPSHHAVGMMIPGIPFVALGRNPWIAWGGTNLHAASSDLVLVPENASLRVREEHIAVLGQPPETLRVHESEWGPVISDLPPFRSSGLVALRWMGHQPSDEITAMLCAGTAQNWTEFRAAFSGYAVPGLEMAFAAASGDIGKITAARLPNRPDVAPGDIAGAPAPGWESPWTADTLPSEFCPQAGFIASANARLAAPAPLIGYHFSPPLRIRRLGELLRGSKIVSVRDVFRIQSDVYCANAVRQRDVICAWLAEMPEHQILLGVLREWDGNYSQDSRAALALETIVARLARDLVPANLREALEAAWASRVLLWRAIHTAPDSARRESLNAGAREAAQNIRTADWGTRHRLVLQHPLGNLPVAGHRYRLFDLPVAGSSETILKTAHGLTAGRHRASYGSVSRHVSDLGRPDENWFALLGGQDGWIGSTTFADQVTIWLRGEYAQIPLRVETVRQSFPHRVVLRPGS